MPELPEVQTVVNALGPLCGQRIRAAWLIRQDIVSPAGAKLPELLAGRQILAIVRRGKKIVFKLDGGQVFYIHLGMSGRLMLVAHDAPVKPHTHLTLNFADSQLRFIDPRRFGGVFWQIDPDKGLGPEPLEMTAAELGSRLRKTTRAAKNALLDQSLVAGLGNIYVDEALFSAKIHPLCPGNQLKSRQISRLSRAIKEVLKRAIAHRGSTLRDYRDPNDEAGRFQKLHRVYHRTGKPCPVCGKPIEKILLGGRSTHFCSRCQRM